MADRRITEWFGAAVLNGVIYVAGGYNSSKTLNNVERYDDTRDEWLPTTPMIEARHYLALAAANGFLYALGGSDAEFSARLSALIHRRPLGHL